MKVLKRRVEMLDSVLDGVVTSEGCKEGAEYHHPCRISWLILLPNFLPHPECIEEDQGEEVVAEVSYGRTVARERALCIDCQEVADADLKTFLTCLTMVFLVGQY